MLQNRTEQNRTEQNRTEQNDSYNLVDVFKWVMAILVVMLHACPLLDISELADYYSSKGITRIAVPYFFVASGFFLFRKMPKGIFEWDILKRYCVRLGKIYIAWGIIYLPMVMWQIYRSDDSLHAFLVVVRDTIFQGALVYHLWYLYASILAALSLYFLFRSGMHLRSILLLGLLLYMIPVAAYSYHGIYAYFFSDDSIVTIFFSYCQYLFRAYYLWTIGVLYMAVGGFSGWYKVRYSQKLLAIFAVVSFLAYIAETVFLQQFDLYYRANNSSYIMFVFVSCLFLLSINVKLKDNSLYKILREQSLFIYLVQPWFLFLCSKKTKKLLGMEQYHLPVFVATLLLSVAVAEILRRCRKYRLASWLC